MKSIQTQFKLAFYYCFKLESRRGAPEAPRPPRPWSGLVFESPFHRLSEEKKLKIRLKLAEIEAIF